ncbi:36.4 kDa proline-rich protein [Salvia miltiorrhiza]|uniref:36.4 kDa proline-rich protein n=1 Tax=Salvia miltiorrhiza TaxID=226208 RepID=UPI0025AB770A|nr:36.4 kDa proline-rich protein [Salvia miltiorrhiza]
MDSFKIFALFLLISTLSISSAVVQPDCGSCSQPAPKKPKPTVPVPPVTVPKLPVPLPPVTVPKLPVPLPPVTVPKLPVPLPPVTVPKLPVPLPPVTVPKLPVPLPPVTVPKLPVPLPPVTVPKLPVPLPPVAVPKLPVPLPPVGGTPKGKSGCPPPPAKGGKEETCPIDTLKLGACVDLLGGLVHVVVGDPAVNECCPIISGLAGGEAAACLCTTLKIKALDLNIFVPLALELLVSCGKSPPPGYTCSL